MAYYSDELIEEIKSANDIVDVIGNYVSLKRKGNKRHNFNNFKVWKSLIEDLKKP